MGKIFSAEGITEEISFLIKDFFECGYKLCGSKIELSFSNGQKFTLNVTQ